MQTIKNYIGGEFCEAYEGETLENREPATGRVYSYLPDSSSEDVEGAVKSALEAFPSWSSTSEVERSEFLLEVACEIEKNLEELAYLESRDQGKPYWLAKKMDIPRAAANFKFFATAILHSESKAFQSQGSLNYTSYEPSGVCALISPWNLPLYLLSWKIAPCLGLGNTAVCKPSELTPMTAFRLAQIFHDLGAPKGICNFVFGTGEKVGPPLVKHKDVPVISFTGGGKSAETITRDSSEQHKKLGLELGGKNPSLVFSDCDLEKCVETHIRSSFLNQGEICLCTSRIYIEKSIYEDFVSLFVEKVKNIKVAPSSSEEAFMGALISESHLEKVLSYVDLAKKEGGNILCGGERLRLDEPYEGGYYLSPTVVAGLSHSSRVVQEEIFGPLVCLFPFETKEEAVNLANDTRYGLAATVWTQNLDLAHSVSKKVKAAQIWVNTWLKRDLRTPFGGMKASGLGREGGYYCYDLYCEQKVIGMDLI